MIATSDISACDDDIPSPATASAYRRRARQIRHRFRNDPASLHLSLKSLATQVDAARPRTATPPPRLQHVKARIVPARVIPDANEADAHIARENDDAARMVAAQQAARQTAVIASGLQSPVEVVEDFSARVRAMLGEGILRFDQRKQLYREAAAMRIDRFEASLIIAAIEHRHGVERPSPRPPGQSQGRSVISIVTGFLLVEALVLAIARALIF